MFGRKLERTGGNSRGPPGLGFKMTEDNQYDIDKKRLCNVAPPIELSDAVNLETHQRMIRVEIEIIKRMIQAEVKTLKNLILEKSQSIELGNLNTIVSAHRMDSNEPFMRNRMRSDSP